MGGSVTLIEKKYNPFTCLASKMTKMNIIMLDIKYYVGSASVS